MVYGLVKGSNFALLLAVAQAFAWVKTLVDGLSIDISALAGVWKAAKDSKRRQKEAKGGRI